ncbi:MAG: fibronectin type III domain-containing protein, partial [Candidatus Sungbacteria bacterium]|nr:fibronectin type III domain-containing protein [Candidatus Sungbacteria bacterium]
MIFAYAAMRAPDPLFHWLRIDQRGSPAATLQTAAVYQTQQNITLRSLTSQVVAVTWSTASPMYASVEYKTTPFIGNTREGSFFPLTSMSPVNYTKVASTRNDLCLTDLTPSTLYYVRVWNKDSQGVESVSPVFTVSTPSPPANAFTFSKQWFGLQLAGEWRSLDSEKYDAWNKDYIRNIRVLEQWDELQPSPNQYIWSFQKNGKGYGIDDQLAEILQRDAQQPKLGSSKFIRMVLQHGGSAYGPQVPTWANEGVETLPNAKNPDDDKFLRWDPQYSCRLWQAIKTMGDRYDTNPKINTVSMPTNSRTGEMPASPSMIALWQQLNYSNNDIARNLKWYYESNANVFSESFPQKRFEMNMGQIQVPDPDNGGIDVSLSILDELATLYPKRITYGSTGAGGIRATYINRYQNKTPVGIYTEIPDANSVTPDLDLQNFFTTYIWPIGDTGGMMGYVTIKDDGLGISPTRG